MSTGSANSSDNNRWFTPTLRIALLVWGIVCIGAYGLYVFTNADSSNEQAAATSETLASTPVDLTLTPAYPVDPLRALPETPPTLPPQGPSPQEIALAKGRWLEFKRRSESTRKRLDSAVEDIRKWSTLMEELPGNEAGRRIAGSASHVDQFLALREKPRPDAEQIEGLRDSLDLHQETTENYLGQSENFSAPDEALTQDLDRQLNETEALALEYRRDRQALEALVSATSALPVAEQTLEQAVQVKASEEANRYRTQLAAAKATATEEALQKIQQAEQAAIRLKTEAEAEQISRVGVETAKRLRTETELHVQQMLAEAKEREREEEASRLRNLAEDPNVQKKYSAFLQQGYVQFSFPPGFMEHRSERPLTVSFNDLIGKGWLKDSETFARAISRRPNTEYRAFNDRPTHPYPRSDAEWKEMERLLEEFKMLAPVWVKMELLRP
ncbi:MAG: hypothetical protein H0T47_15525 [Planctomycetaceae bacterium]|nr:hypothetical protein [Planctomycetaceae bacterium]